jgi:hypothetical protein
MTIVAPVMDSSLWVTPLLHQVADHDDQDQVLGAELAQLAAADGARHDEDQQVDEDGPQDEIHGGLLRGRR